MSYYCPACLDVWTTDPERVQRRDWVNIRPGIHLHVVCGRALHHIASQPPIEEDAA